MSNEPEASSWMRGEHNYPDDESLREPSAPSSVYMINRSNALAKSGRQGRGEKIGIASMFLPYLPKGRRVAKFLVRSYAKSASFTNGPQHCITD